MYIRIQRKGYILQKVSGRGNQKMACCPFHEDKKPSFTFNLEKNVYYCFSCRRKGRLDTEKDIKAVRVDRNNEMSLDLEDKNKNSLSLPDSFISCFNVYGKEIFIPDYLLQRRIWKETIQDFRLGYSLKMNTVIIPFWQEGVFLGYEERDWRMKEKRFCRGMKTRKVLYGWDWIKYLVENGWKSLVLVEGVFDFFRVYQAINKFGLDFCCGALLGKNGLSLEKVEMLKSLKRRGLEKVIILLDADCSQEDIDNVAKKLILDFEVFIGEVVEKRKDPAECNESEIREVLLERIKKYEVL